MFAVRLYNQFTARECMTFKEFYKTLIAKRKNLLEYVNIESFYHSDNILWFMYEFSKQYIFLGKSYDIANWNHIEESEYEIETSNSLKNMLLNYNNYISGYGEENIKQFKKSTEIINNWIPVI